MIRLSATATASATRHGQRHPEHQVEQGVEGDLAEQRVREQLGVVVEADELDAERVAHVGAAHVGEAHAEAGQHRPGGEDQEQQRRTAGPGPMRRQPAAAAWGRRAGWSGCPPAPRSSLRAVGHGQRPVPIDDALDCISLTASSAGVCPSTTCSTRESIDGGDLLPGRDGRRRLGGLELLAEDLQLRVLGELAGVPGGLDGGQVADQVVEVLLGLGLAEPLDVLPGGVGVVGVLEDREVSTADERRAGSRTSLPGSGATAYSSVRQRRRPRRGRCARGRR